MSEKEIEAFKKSDDFHNQAMDISLLADRAKSRKNMMEAKQLYEQAFELEKQAALEMNGVKTDKLWRAVLFRSAAWLAFHSEKYLEAIGLAHEGLSGNPPEMIEVELYDVLEQAIAKMKSRHQQAMELAA